MVAKNKRKNLCNTLKIRAKKWSQRSESNRGPVHYEAMLHMAAYILVISQLHTQKMLPGGPLLDFH